jgi:hypothetical protein
MLVAALERIAAGPPDEGNDKRHCRLAGAFRTADNFSARGVVDD